MPAKKNTTASVLAAHRQVAGKVETKGRVKIKTREEFAVFYTPGVGKVAEHLAAHPEDARRYSVKRNSVAVISDGTAVLGLGNIGPYGALPVMEGKSLIFREFAGIDAWPIVLDIEAPFGTKERTDEIVRIVKAIAPAFGGINLEDIKAPECFEVERRLIKELSIPVMHDDQHGTAIVVLAGLMNAAKVVGKSFKTLKVILTGAGAAGTAVAKLLVKAGIEDIVVIDTTGAIYQGREGLVGHKAELAKITNPRKVKGNLMETLHGADAFIGLSGHGVLHQDMVRGMAKRSIVFALANPVPEIMPDEAKRAGADVIATGRSDFPNQINNALAFPGVFRGALDRRVEEITDEMKLKAAKAIASLVPAPTAGKIVPDIFDTRLVPAVAKAIR